MSIIKAEQGMLTIRCNNEIVWIEPWGRDALRVRACKAEPNAGRGLGFGKQGEFAAEIEAGPGKAVISVTASSPRRFPGQAR